MARQIIVQLLWSKAAAKDINNGEYGLLMGLQQTVKDSTHKGKKTGQNLSQKIELTQL